ncbi:hypothetical protein CEXT_513041 [Caerostris extrusa]|uniref:Alpha-latrotoxin n=1 Tax=Caerostris extrusa TaxID=172846 RepID=A0AAV4T7P8_CAEEX|nr:hypothetical protein CEXT_513041 [Caerostris extrusa]
MQIDELHCILPVMEGSIACLDFLFKMGADVHTPQSPLTPLHVACQEDSVECAEILESFCIPKYCQCHIPLKMGADVHTPQSPLKPLHTACMCENLECVRILLKYGPNINALNTDRQTPLHFTCYKGRAACTESLLQMGADIHAAQSPHTPLH